MRDLDEYKSFTAEPPVAIDCSPLAWWLREEQQQRYPCLSKMAVDILSIPAMSAEPERVFSGARRTISWDRCRLGSHAIERGECMKSWIKSGITQGIPVDLAGEEEKEEAGEMERTKSRLKETPTVDQPDEEDNYTNLKNIKKRPMITSVLMTKIHKCLHKCNRLGPCGSWQSPSTKKTHTTS
ncbi:Ribonuclease H-like protein [Hirsutella rhossiliensis]|uniref:Ribonuclease H-like protein n=1 Tax=Hirsutella rhossiliensis TaxID=111463 RepID=A0A9P8SFW9_9HYPO|nr:Ribonuclease H-like protein [Hirsutella rhossiliensis]KAH0961201.1 Ribonuclease H-like protein [Hirsutella rhossiliensis]